MDEIALYNAEDVHSTRGLRDWLLELRQELVETGAQVTWRPDPEESEANEKREAADAETAALRERLRATGDADDDLLAELLLYHRREAKPTWWWYFERRKMSLEDLHDDDEAIAALEPDGDEGTINHSRLVPMRFPLQQFKLGPGKVLDPVSDRAGRDPHTRRRTGHARAEAGPKGMGRRGTRCADPWQALQHRRAAGGAAANGTKRARQYRRLSGLPVAAGTRAAARSRVIRWARR